MKIPCNALIHWKFSGWNLHFFVFALIIISKNYNLLKLEESEKCNAIIWNPGNLTGSLKFGVEDDTESCSVPSVNLTPNNCFFFTWIISQEKMFFGEKLRPWIQQQQPAASSATTRMVSAFSRIRQSMILMNTRVKCFLSWKSYWLPMLSVHGITTRSLTFVSQAGILLIRLGVVTVGANLRPVKATVNISELDFILKPFIRNISVFWCGYGTSTSSSLYRNAEPRSSSKGSLYDPIFCTLLLLHPLASTMATGAGGCNASPRLAVSYSKIRVEVAKIRIHSGRI